MKETVTRCSICKKEDCDGKEYIVDIGKNYAGIPLQPHTICTSMIQFNKKGQRRIYHVVAAHGIEYDIDIGEQMKRQAK